MWTTKRIILEELCKSAKRFYPDEFMCFLAGDKENKVLNEIVLMPTTNGKDFASIQESIIPIDESIIASVHSHPDSIAKPSEADKIFFKRYKINIIISGEYDVNSIRFYDNNSHEIQVAITK